VAIAEFAYCHGVTISRPPPGPCNPTRDRSNGLGHALLPTPPLVPACSLSLDASRASSDWPRRAGAALPRNGRPHRCRATGQASIPFLAVVRGTHRRHPGARLRDRDAARHAAAEKRPRRFPGRCGTGSGIAEGQAPVTRRARPRLEFGPEQAILLMGRRLRPPAFSPRDRARPPGPSVRGLVPDLPRGPRAPQQERP
jgi:hypothetical protein